MHIRSVRTYRFPAVRPSLWRAIQAVDRYESWWPWLREFDGTALEQGAVWSCVVQPPLPYQVRFRISLDEVVEHEHIVASLDGDIVGTARLELRDRGPECEAHLTSQLAPDNRALRAVALLARPLVRYGHDWVLDTGANQFTHRFAHEVED